MILSRALLSILALFFGIVLYLVFMRDLDQWRWAILPLVLIAIVTYIFSSELNHWWLNRYPTDLDKKEHQFLIRHHSYYKELSPARQKQYGRECIAFHRKRDFILQGVPNFPDDVKVLWSAQALDLKYLLDLPEPGLNHYETVVVYPHPFITPEIDHVHASETHHEEGVWLFSVEQVIFGMTQPARFFNIVLYEFLRAARQRHPDWLEEIEEHDLCDLKQVRLELSNISDEHIRGWLNVPEIDWRSAYVTILVSHWPYWRVMHPLSIDRIPLARYIQEVYQRKQVPIPTNLSR